MTRLINTALITVFAFFVFLGVFWQFAHGGTGAGPRGDPTVTAVTPRWQPTSPQQDLLVDLTVHNPAGADGQVIAITYEALVDGKLVDRAVARVPPGGPVVIPAQGDAPVRFAVDLPDGFATTWWTSYMKDAEASDMRIHGNLTLKRDDGVHPATFEWRSSWTGDLAKRLESAVRNCDSTPSDLCMASSDFAWKDGTLHAHLTLHNPGPDAVDINNTTLQLLFADRAVVSGKVDLAKSLLPGDDGQVDLALSFSQSAIAAWWPDHLARCERTPVALGMDLQAQTVPDDSGKEGEVTNLQWTFPASTFQTRFVCGS